MMWQDTYKIQIEWHGSLSWERSGFYPSATFSKSFQHTCSVETEYWSKDGPQISPTVVDVIIDPEETDTDSEFSDDSDFDHFD